MDWSTYTGIGNALFSIGGMMYQSARDEEERKFKEELEKRKADQQKSILEMQQKHELAKLREAQEITEESKRRQLLERIRLFGGEGLVQKYNRISGGKPNYIFEDESPSGDVSRPERFSEEELGIIEAAMAGKSPEAIRLEREAAKTALRKQQAETDAIAIKQQIEGKRLELEEKRLKLLAQAQSFAQNKEQTNNVRAALSGWQGVLTQSSQMIRSIDEKLAKYTEMAADPINRQSKDQINEAIKGLRDERERWLELASEASNAMRALSGDRTPEQARPQPGGPQTPGPKPQAGQNKEGPRQTIDIDPSHFRVPQSKMERMRNAARERGYLFAASLEEYKSAPSGKEILLPSGHVVIKR